MADSDVKTAKDVGKAAGKVVSEINTFNLAMNIGKDSNKSDILKVTELLSGSSLSKISAGLGMVGAVVGLVAVFSGAKSTEDLILEMLGDISDKIDSLQSLMLARFDRLESVVEQVVVSGSLSEAFATIDTAVSSANLLLKAENDDEREDAIKYLRRIDILGLRNAVNQINHTVHGKGWENNVYESNLKTSYGDMDVIQDIGCTLNYYILAAQLMESLVKSVNEIPDDMLRSVASGDGEKLLADIPDSYVKSINAITSNAEKYYSDYLDTHTKEWNASINDVLDRAKHYMGEYCNEKLFTEMNAKNHADAVDFLTNRLKAHWGWYDFFAVVYDDVSSFQKHCMIGGTYHAYFRQQIKGGKANIVFAWKDKEKKALGSTRDSIVRYTYEALQPGYIDGNFKTYHYNDKPAEDFGQWRSLEDVSKSLVNKNSKPTASRMVWMCVKKKGVSRTQTNSERVLWKNGSHLDFAIFE